MSILVMEGSLPLPLEPSPSTADDNTSRLWVGNLDSRISEYHMIKTLQKYGKVKKFDFLFHKSGPQKGMPRGYCFVTYERKQQAECALQALDGKIALSQKLSVKWAHNAPNHYEVSTHPKPPVHLPGTLKEEVKKTKSIKNQISAIEAKLKSMEKEKELELESCLIRNSVIGSSTRTLRENSVPDKQRKPYTRSTSHRNSSFKRRVRVCSQRKIEVTCGSKFNSVLCFSSIISFM
ncbi:putative RNA-binding protein 18 isoform X1 [Tachypleus tridentatus]|uniref:putative RNA-binding protein 18 isoform X1 n=2 Tax=Tachypleus tridentatus TaxID=6853 RepID=UPI003FD22E2B